MKNPMAEIHYHVANGLNGLPAQRAKELLREAMPDFMADSAAVVAVQNHIQRLTQAEIYKLDGEQE